MVLHFIWGLYFKVVIKILFTNSDSFEVLEQLQLWLSNKDWLFSVNN